MISIYIQYWNCEVYGIMVTQLAQKAARNCIGNRTVNNNTNIMLIISMTRKNNINTLKQQTNAERLQNEKKC
jgi:hypothetical protein